jgi:hypothetical protein
MLGKALLSASVSASAPGVYVEDVFSTYLYTGNGGLNAIANGIDLAGEGGLVWIKSRGSSQNHVLTDTLRGDATYLSSNTTAANTSGGGIYLGDGFAAIGSSALTNASGDTYASWTFRKAPKFFDVVTWSGNNTNNREIPHNLGSAPGCIIVKNTTESTAWYVWHRSLPPSGSSAANLRLNTTAAVDYSDYYVTDNSTSEYIKLGLAGGLNETGRTYVAYLFAHDAGGFGDAGADNVISCGSYTGNGSTDGPTVTLGFEPQFLMIKSASGIGSWEMHDVMRGIPTGGSSARLFADTSGGESSTQLFDVTATGFKLTGINSYTNANGTTYIYIAIRRGPMRAPDEWDGGV